MKTWGQGIFILLLFLLAIMSTGISIQGFLSLHNLDNAHNLMRVESFTGTSWVDQRADGRYMSAQEIWHDDYPGLWMVLGTLSFINITWFCMFFFWREFRGR